MRRALSQLLFGKLPLLVSETQRHAFVALHKPAFEADEIRHSLLLSIVDRWRNDEGGPSGIRAWTFGKAGECAMQTPGYPIVLGNLSAEQCRTFAEAMNGDDFPGVVGPGESALRFAETAEQLGASFAEKKYQLILLLTEAPQVPGVPGAPRRLSSADFALFRAWVASFIQEAIPSDPIPDDESLRASIASRRHWFWTYEGKPVAMASLTRRTRNAAFINSVFTPHAYRNQGFGAAITAFVARQIFQEGRAAASLYVDADNRASMRCYAKLGFKPLCDSWLIVRRKGQLH
jgi:RimJ/RimL family protein N-acetyltransferase